MVQHSAAGRSVQTVRGDVELSLDAYAAEFAEFAAAVQEERAPAVTGEDARRALAVALAAIESVRSRRPVSVAAVDR
jgi:myo-inositol 2-dehydrogenase/D-chiro-inositol 1-dehydrogenase